MSWSLFKRNNEKGGIFDYSGERLEPLKFTNGKTQEDVVSEVMNEIKKGTKTIFIHGVCGTGKSAIALNIAKNFKKSSIVVPIKSLQEQYEKDYTQKMFVLKEDKKPLKISVIKGRNNFRCPYSAGECADDTSLPCTIEIRDKNTEELLNYVQKNPLCDVSDFSSASDVRRMNIAPACPYWAPIMPSDVNPKLLGEYKKIEYTTITGKSYALFQRKKGCGYYDQYESYANSDVLIFNSRKYLIENSMTRKPATDIEIIDECDEFLDSFANERKININRLINSLNNLIPKESKNKRTIKEFINKLNYFLLNSKEIECEKLEKTEFFWVIEFILENPNLAEDEEFNYYNTIVEIVRSFESILADSYISVERVKKESGQEKLFGKESFEEVIYVTIVSINLAQRFKELLEDNKVFVLMSGTLHSPEVLKDLFGIKDFKIIEAENTLPGEIKKIRTGVEKNCSYANFKKGIVNRKLYLKILDLCLSQAIKPVMVHVNSFSDLPSEKENDEYKFDNLISKERLIEMQINSDFFINSFNMKKEKILFTTKCSRGVDFAGDKCRSIIITRFPYPNINRLFWKILKKEQPDKFMEFYVDKARRELLQKISRAVRFKGDWVNLLSPDIRVLNNDFD